MYYIWKRNKSYKTSKIVDKFKLDHNDLHVDRGVWRTFNPYNPYDSESELGGGGITQNLESLDDIFNDEISTSSPASESTSKPNTTNNKKDDKKRQEELVDIQKELEAKFDELFGSIDDE